MTRILFVGQKPETVDFSDPSLPPGFDSDKINAGIAFPPKSLALFETVVNIIHKATPNAAIAFNTKPEDTADATARQIETAYGT